MWILFRASAANAATVGLFSILRAKKQEEKSKKNLSRPSGGDLAGSNAPECPIVAGMSKLGYGVGMADSHQQQPEVEMGDFPRASEAPILAKRVPSPLVDCPDPIVRAGVVAILADRHEKAERLAKDRKSKGWTACQFGDHLLLEQLRLHQSKWVQYLDRAARGRAREQFNQYAYRWY